MMMMGLVKMVMVVKMMVVRMEMVMMRVVRKVMVVVGVTVSVLSEIGMVRLKNMTVVVLEVGGMRMSQRNRELCCLKLLRKPLMLQ